MNRNPIPLVALAVLLAAPSFAQEGQKSVATLNEVVVTDTRIPQPQDSVTQNVALVYAEEMDSRSATNRNLTELFQYEGGQFVNPLSRNDANWGSYGGLGPKYNSYLLDGLPVDSFVDTMSLDPWAFDRAELHKGPASVLYANYLTMDFAGNQAPLAGTTNLILKDRIDEPGSRIMAGYGSWNTYNAKLYHQGSKDNLHYFFGAGHENSDYTNYGTTPSWLNMLDDPDYQKTKVYGKVSHFFSPASRVSLFAHHTSHDGDAGRPHRDYSHNYDTVNLDWLHQFNEDISLQVKAGYRGYDRNWSNDHYPDSLALRDRGGVEQKIFPGDLTLSYKHSGNSVLTAGADYQAAQYSTYSETDGIRAVGNDVDALSYSLFAQEKWLLLDDRLVLRAGGRFNRTEHTYDMISGGVPGKDSQSWSKFLWSGGARWNLSPALAVYANAGSSFMAPSAKSVGGTLPASDRGLAGQNGQLPNPDLEPESGIAYDAGAEFRPQANFKLGIRAFLNKVDDAIVENVISEDPSQTQSVNAGEAKSYGVEVSAEHGLTRSLSWFANLTWTESEISNPLDADQDGSELSFSPDLVINAGLHFSLPGYLMLSPYLQNVGTYYDGCD